MIDILVLNYNDAYTTIAFVNSVKNFSCIQHILIVDNHSIDNSLEQLKTLECDKIIVVDSGRNGGYGFGNNFGIKYLRTKFHSEHVLICNPDVVVSDNVVQKLSNFLDDNVEYAVVAPRMEIPNNRNSYSAFKDVNFFSFLLSVELFFSKIFSPMYINLQKLISYEKVDVFSVAGSLFMVNLLKFPEGAIYDEHIFLYYEEFVLGKECKKNNCKVAVLPQISFLHNHSVSITKTYKNNLKKQSVYLKSYRYVVKKYFGKFWIAPCLSYILSVVSLFEIFVWSLFKDKKKI